MRAGPPPHRCTSLRSSASHQVVNTTLRHAQDTKQSRMGVLTDVALTWGSRPVCGSRHDLVALALRGPRDGHLWPSRFFTICERPFSRRPGSQRRSVSFARIARSGSARVGSAAGQILVAAPHRPQCFRWLRRSGRDEQAGDRHDLIGRRGHGGGDLDSSGYVANEFPLLGRQIVVCQLCPMPVFHSLAPDWLSRKGVRLAG